MFASILAVAGQEQDALQAILDGVAQGDVVLAIVGGVILVGLVVLAAFKKNLPFIGPLVEAILTVARSLSKKKAKPSDQAGAAGVLPIRVLDQSQDDEKK